MTDYYVKNGGDDSKNGQSDANAWETLAKVTTEIGNGTFGAGDSISLKCGSAWSITSSANCIRLAGSSGSVSSPIYIIPYGTGARPLLQGTSWFWRGMIFREDGDAAANYWWIEGLELSGMYGSAGVWLSGVHHHTLYDLLIQDSQDNTNWKAGIRLVDDARDILIDSCQIEDLKYAEGVYIGTPSDASDRCRLVTVRNTSIKRMEHEGADCKDGSRCCTFHNNTFEDNGYGVDRSHIALGGTGHHVYQNRFKGTFEGIGGNHEQAIFMGQYSGGQGHTIERNLFEDETGIYGAIRMIGSYEKVLNNTFVNCRYAVYGQAGVSGSNEIKNNIFEGMTSYAIYLTNAASYYLCNYNCYGDGPNLIWYQGGAGRNLSYVQGTLGQELNASSSDPSFAEETDYTLNPGSPCVDAGDSSAIVEDYEDKYDSGDVDMGWQEYGWLVHRVFQSTIEDTGFARFTGYTGVTADATTVYTGSYSLKADLTDQSDRYAYCTGLGNLEHLYADFQVNADSLSMAGSDSFILFHGRTSGGVALALIGLQYDGSNYQIRGGIINDADSWTNTSWYTLAAGWNWIQFHWFVSPDTSYNEGEFRLWLNGTEKEALSSVNNHDRTIDQFRIGAVTGLDVGTSGQLYVDAIRIEHLRRMAEQDQQVSGGQPRILRGLCVPGLQQWTRRP